MNWEKDELVLVINQDASRSLSRAKPLQNHARKYKLKTVSCRGIDLDHIIRQALDHKKLKRLIIAGGDGSVATAARLVMKLRDDVEIAVIPTGTANYYTRSLGFKTLSSAFSVAVSGICEKRYLCRANNRVFLMAGSIGVSSRMFDMVSNKHKKLFGRMAYFWGMARLIFSFKPMRVNIHANGEVLKFVTTEVDIVNQNIFSIMKIKPEIHSREPFFEIVTYGTKDTKLSPLFAIVMFLVTLGINQKYLKRIKTTKAKITTNRPEVVTLDGDVLENTPVELEVCKKPVKFLVAK